MMSTSLRRALRTVFTLAFALVALAAVAGSAMASALLPTTREPPELIVLGGSGYNATDNEYSINLGGELNVDLGIAGRRFEPFAAALPVEIQSILCAEPEFAGVYGVIGLLTEPWRPSRSADSDNRVAGLSVWANELGAATVPVSREGCRGPTAPFPGQVRLEIDEEFLGEFLASTRLSFCTSGGNYVLTGTSVGSGGRSSTYLVPSTSGVWQFYTLGAFGTLQESNEEVVNLRFTGFPRESAACPAL